MGMKLTDEQRLVVEIDAGSHLVLAPPGSGKTEILSQRILHAMRTGVNPERMLCATFTNRAAYEMRSRVEAQGAGVVLPEVGNLHHFCFRFLRSVGRLSPAKHVLDDCEQLSFAKEVVDVLREELKAGRPCGKEARGVSGGQRGGGGIGSASAAIRTGASAAIRTEAALEAGSASAAIGAGVALVVGIVMKRERG